MVDCVPISFLIVVFIPERWIRAFCERLEDGRDCRNDGRSLPGIAAHENGNIGLNEKDAGSRGDALIHSNVFGDVFGSGA